VRTRGTTGLPIGTCEDTLDTAYGLDPSDPSARTQPSEAHGRDKGTTSMCLAPTGQVGRRRSRQVRGVAGENHARAETCSGGRASPPGEGQPVDVVGAPQADKAGTPDADSGEQAAGEACVRRGGNGSRLVRRRAGCGAPRWRRRDAQFVHDAFLLRRKLAGHPVQAHT